MRVPLRKIMIGSVAAALGALALSLSLGAEDVEARDDWQLWHEETARVLQRGAYTLSLYQATRYRDDFSDPYFLQGKLIHAYRLQPWLSVAAGYSYIQQKGADNHWREEHRWDAEATPLVSVGPFTLDNRLRMELRAIEDSAGEEEWRYRNRLQVRYPLPRLDGKLVLFANEELFYAIPPDAWNQHRLFVGLRARPSTPVTASLAWGIQSLRRGNDWEDRQVLLASLQLTF